MRTKAFFAVALLTALVGLASVASAQVQFVGVGSSAMFNTLSAAAFTDLCSSRTGSDCHHWSQSGKRFGHLGHVLHSRFEIACLCRLHLVMRQPRKHIV